MAERRTGRPRTGEARFAAYLDEITTGLGHSGRAAAARAYCTGLLLPGERKSVEPMAARIEPGRVGARHQSLHHMVAKAEWSDVALLAAVRGGVLPALERHGPVRYWIVDDTGFPKQGVHSVGVARQSCGQLGKGDNCQVAVSLSVANDGASLPLAYQLYLPETWAGDPERRARAGVPEEIGFATKPEIALAQIRQALEEEVPPGVVLGDAGYGADTAFRWAIAEAGLTYVLGVQSSASLWPPGEAPLPPPPYGGRGRPPTRIRRAPGQEPISARKLAESLPKRAFRTVTRSAASPGRRSGSWWSGRRAPRSRRSTGSPTCRPGPP
jgi:SRSO17 transposase